MLRYPVKLMRDTNGSLAVTAPDFPEVSSFGEDEFDALGHAADAIATAIQGRISDRQEVPEPSQSKRGHRMVLLPALTEAKLELYRLMQATKTSKANLARRMGVHGPQIDRLLDLDHDSRFDQLENAFRALGREMHISIRRIDR